MDDLSIRIQQKFYAKTMPELVRQLGRLGDSLEALAPDQDAARQNDLVEAMRELVVSAEQLFDTEVVPGSEPTRQAFRRLRHGVQAANELIGSLP